MPEYIVTEHKFDKCTVRIHRPILTAEETKKVDEGIKKALILYGRERMRNQK